MTRMTIRSAANVNEASGTNDVEAESVEWEMVLANELTPDGVGLPDKDLVILASTALLNQAHNFEIIHLADKNSFSQQDFLFPKLFRACYELQRDREMGGYALAVIGKANYAMHRYLIATREFRESISLCPNDCRLYEALADCYAMRRMLPQTLESLVMAERIVGSTSRPLDGYRIRQKKGQILFHLSRHREAIDCLEQNMTEYERVKAQLSIKHIADAAMAQFILCTAYIMLEKNKDKYNHHWVQATAKRNSLPGELKRSLNWEAMETAAASLKKMEERNGCFLVFCFVLFVLLVSFARRGKMFDRRDLIILPGDRKSSAEKMWPARRDL